MDWTAGEYAITITPQQVKTIFLELRSIHALNSMLCRELQERFTAWDGKQCIGGEWLAPRRGQPLGRAHASLMSLTLHCCPLTPAKDIFVKLLMFFKTYLTFANNFDNAITTIGVCRQNKSFNLFLQCVWSASTYLAFIYEPPHKAGAVFSLSVFQPPLGG